MQNELPKDPAIRDKYILQIFGSPDKRQIDGLGGADVLTSKLAIIGPSTREDADVDYTFGQVSFDAGFIDYKSNCGNISAGVGPFAINKGMVLPVEPYTTVRIHQVNTNTIIKAKVKVCDGKAEFDGDCFIDGVLTGGSPIELDFSDSLGTITGKLLPTGNAIDSIYTEDGNAYKVSIVDAAIPTVFIKAEDLGLDGTEVPDVIEKNESLMNKVEEIRGKCAEKIGLVEDYRESTAKSPYSPFITLVSEAKTYTTFQGKVVKEENIDILSRLIFMQRMHKAHPVTGTICMSVAARIPGSIVWETLTARGKTSRKIVIGHPSGEIPVASEVSSADGNYTIEEASITRTARIIMDGSVYIRTSQL
ncbi:PrpF domain-containing protein [Bacillota bacterium]